jgi:hypothetical protein
MLGRMALHLASNPCESYKQQILQIPTHAVRSEGADIMNMELAVQMGLSNLFWIDAVEPVIAHDLLGDVDIEALERIGHVAVFFDPPVHLIQVVVDYRNIAEQLCDFSDVFVLFSIEDVGFGCFGVTVFDESLFYDILHMFDRGNAAGIILAPKYSAYFFRQLPGCLLIPPPDSLNGLPDGICYFV